MNEKFMSKTTFAEICKMMKKGNKKDRECIQSILNMGLVFLPMLISPELGLLSNLSTGADLLAIKGVAENVGQHLLGFFEPEGLSDFSSRYERVQAAQVLMVFSAYFDSIRFYLPDETRHISLSNQEKIAITEKSIEDYVEWLKKEPKTHSPEATMIMDFPLDLRAPLESEDDYYKRLNRFYEMLNEQFIGFFNKLAFWEQLPESKKDSFMAVIRKLPETALENYKKQNYELRTQSPDFKIWSEIQDTYGLSKQIDVGFHIMSEQIRFFVELANSNQIGIRTLDKYATKYRCYVDDALVQTSEMELSSFDGIALPKKKDIFIPQSFKALRFEKNIRLESDLTWDNLHECDKIGKFILDTLRHSVSGKTPLLILGVPGAGKTLLCHMLAAQILSSEYHVLIIRLRDTHADNTITQQINEQIERDYANGCKWEDITSASMSKPILLIFDGYDELLQASGKTYADYINKIKEFQRDQGYYNIQVKSILTSRTTLIDKAAITEGTTVIKLSDFDENRINQWTTIWNNANGEYFNQNHLVPFSVDAKSKIYELAKQPLLLLLLALYDSNENALKNNAELTGAQLYDRLIREFISREQRKNVVFAQYEDEQQKDIIDREMQRVSIAALGMYNRRVLYIRSEELEKDLSYLLPDEDENTSSTRGDLKKSEKLLGSFFFIHKSDTPKNNRLTNAKDVAYEFLHNTFGEFLVANYIVTSLYHELNHIIYMQTQKKKQWDLFDKKQWFISLSYSPLFTRPVVIRMILEWADGFFHEQNIENSKAVRAMKGRLKEELQRIISGKDIIELENTLSENGNPFEKRESLEHLACYSINLLILGSLICKEEAFECDNRTWDKLICLWRYAFSEGDLLDFADMFLTMRNDDVCYLKYFPEMKKSVESQSHVRQIAKINLAIGDALSGSLTSTILGEGDTKTILNRLKENKLEVSLVFLWNKISQNLSHNNTDNLVTDLRELRDTSIEHGTIWDVLTYYLLIESLLKNSLLKIEQFDYRTEIIKGVKYINTLSHSTHFEDETPFSYLVKTLFSIAELSSLQFLVLEFQIELSRFPLSLKLWSFIQLIKISMIKMESINNINNNEDTDVSPIAISYDVKDIVVITGFLDHVYGFTNGDSWNYESICLRGPFSFDEYVIFEATYKMLKIFDMSSSFDFDYTILVEAWIGFLTRCIETSWLRCTSTSEKVFFIRTLYLLDKMRLPIRGSLFPQLLTMYNSITGLSFKDIYDTSQDAAYELCIMIEEGKLPPIDEMEKGLSCIQKEYGDDLSVKMYQKIESMIKSKSYSDKNRLIKLLKKKISWKQ